VFGVLFYGPVVKPPVDLAPLHKGLHLVLLVRAKERPVTPPGRTAITLSLSDISTTIAEKTTFLGSAWANIYRVAETTSGIATDRPVMATVVDMEDPPSPPEATRWPGRPRAPSPQVRGSPTLPSMARPPRETGFYTAGHHGMPP
jgi:hypothetical protein